MEEQSIPPSSPHPSPPTVIHVKPEHSHRTVVWILLSVGVGFLLPVCSCALFLFASITSLGLLDGESSTSVETGDAVAIVRVEGTIVSSDDDNLGAGATSSVVIADLETAVSDPSVKAIILRVDSPGGSVTGSAQIHEVVAGIDKPVIVSMAGIAASGGYYVSAPADHIFARADTLTGSIGVIMTLFNAEELIDEIGVDVIQLTSGPNKAMGSSWEALEPEHQQILETIVDEYYDEFVRVVADGRGMTQDAVRILADGRIYTGRQALDNGLVDELGNFQDAIDKAADLGGITGEPRLVEYEHLPTLTDLFSGLNSRLQRTEADQILEIMEEFMMPAVEYRYVGPSTQ